ncbi:MAG: hypothetical protein JW908_16630 [Anaerolineales bacterium]|nr:hypothetical protein [Anaerolineales bacterium]
MATEESARSSKRFFAALRMTGEWSSFRKVKYINIVELLAMTSPPGEAIGNIDGDSFDAALLQ